MKVQMSRKITLQSSFIIQKCAFIIFLCLPNFVSVFEIRLCSVQLLDRYWRNCLRICCSEISSPSKSIHRLQCVPYYYRLETHITNINNDHNRSDDTNDAKHNRTSDGENKVGNLPNDKSVKRICFLS